MFADATPIVEPDQRFAALDVLFFVIGAQKAGTSWLQAYLRRHPQVCVPVYKELNYWSTMRGGISAGRMLDRRIAARDKGPALVRLLRGLFRRDADQSLLLVQKMFEKELPGHRGYADALFQKLDRQRIAGELNPQYALLEQATFAEMAALARDVRFAFVMRDPVSRYFSHLKHAVRAEHGESGVTAERVSDLWQRQLAAGPDALCLRRSRYDDTIRKLEAAVRPDRIGYFFFETLFTQAEIDRFCRLIGAGSVSGAFDRVRNRGGGTSIPMRTDLAQATLESLAPTYAYLRDRFGDMIPASWQTPDATFAESALVQLQT